MYFNYNTHQALVFMYVIYRHRQPNMQLSLCETVKTGKFWKLFYHSEFMGNWFRDFESVKSTALTHLKALDFDFLNFCTFWRVKLTKITKFRALEIAKMAILDILDSPKMISSKNLRQENLENCKLALISLPRSGVLASFWNLLLLLGIWIQYFHMWLHTCSQPWTL